LSGSLRAINSTSRASRMRYLSTSNAISREDRPKSTKGLSPKILTDNPPKAEDQPEDVKKHNKEMAERADKANAQIEKKGKQPSGAKTESSSK
jgi:hypothetical protein